MQEMFTVSIFLWIILIIILAAVIYLFRLIVRALKAYINSREVRKEMEETRKSLAEILKKYRTDNKMTQEFVAEAVGVSRQAVSKWEQGLTEPSTSNLIALGKLYGTTGEEILEKVKKG